MEQHHAPLKPSALPRPASRLPVPRSTLRASPSSENLQQPSRISQSISNPRLRPSPSRDSISTSTSGRPIGAGASSRLRDTVGAGSNKYAGSGVSVTARQPLLQRKSSSNALFKKPKQPARVEPVQHMQDALSPEGEGQVESALEEEAEGTRKSSLSERTMETLQRIPSSPSVRQRKSSFFSPEGSMRPPSRSSQPSPRPDSSHTDTSMRPPARSSSSRSVSTSSSNAPPLPVDVRKHPEYHQPASLQSTPTKATMTSRSLRTPSSIRSLRAPGSSSSIRLSSPGIDYATTREKSASPVDSPTPVQTIKQPVYNSGSQTVTSRSLKPRASVKSLFKKASMTNLRSPRETPAAEFEPKKNSPTFSNTSSDDRSASSFSTVSSKGTAPSIQDDRPTSPPKSSLTLREQIAKAKAAKRSVVSSVAIENPSDQDLPVVPTASFDFGLPQDPFNLKPDPNGSKAVLRKRVQSARTDGRLNIAAMGLKSMPEEILQMYDLESCPGGSWAESVDLTRFIAADNEFEVLGEDIFPDLDPHSVLDDDDEAKGNQFGGLETLDLHGNLLVTVPMGLRRLELLTVLNLSNNKLGNDCIAIISQIPALRDLKIAGNRLTGTLDESIAMLKSLEVLTLERNSLTALPGTLAELSHLRMLNVSENQLLELPFEAMKDMPLIELVARKNRLSGVLIPGSIEKLAHLQILDVTANSLKRLATSTLEMPALHQLSCSCNRISALPDMTSWSSLLTIAAEDNSIASLPEGFVELPKVRTVDFSGNDIKILDDKIGAMDSLVVFRISGNPLREKKLSGMTTENMKRVLKARLVPAETEIHDGESVDDEFLTPQSTPTRPSTEWPVKAGGILDRSSTQLTSLNPVTVAQIASDNAIRVLELHHNRLREIPSSVAFFASTLTTLSMAHNELTSDTYLTEELELPALKELNLSANTFDSLQPLIQHLVAPQLEKLDISFNRLTNLPVLRSHFPKLTTILASNNTIRELSPEAVKGLHVLDCNSNDISSLNARIGLLGGPGGLHRLDVNGNRFRVPKYTVLDKGTEATLAWLKDRIPAEELANIADVD